MKLENLQKIKEHKSLKYKLILKAKETYNLMVLGYENEYGTDKDIGTISNCFDVILDGISLDIMDLAEDIEQKLLLKEKVKNVL